MDIQLLAKIATQEQICVSLTFDPSAYAAEVSESWIVEMGLDNWTAGATPEDAIVDALTIAMLEAESVGLAS